MTTCDAEANFNAEQLRALHDLGKLVTASLDLDTTLTAIVEAARELTGAQLLAILLVEDADHLVIRIGLGQVAAAVGERVRADQGVVGRAMLGMQPVLVEDMLAERGRARPDLDAQSGLRTYLALPLIWRGEALGALTVGSAQPAALSPTAIALMRELAEQAAVAVAHAREYSREQARRMEVEQLYRALEERTEALERAQAQLVQAEKMAAIGQLAHGIAHELNTPLGVIVSNLSVLRQYADALARVSTAAQETVGTWDAGGPLEVSMKSLDQAVSGADLAYVLEDLPQLLGESTTSADRIAVIVRSVATFARRDTDRSVRVDVGDVLEAAMTLASHELKHRAEVRRELREIPPILGHTSELTQVFVHLLLNASQSLEDKHGKITVSADHDEEAVVITITDTGRGIPPEHLPRVFDPFFTTRPPGHGTGMGLAVCHGVVTRHGGTIHLASRPGQGTVVTIRLPVSTSGRAVA